MTNITFKIEPVDKMMPQTRKIIFSSKGHAGYGLKGADIVCAAVSILSYTLAREMERIEADGGLAAYSSTFGQGDVRIEAIPCRFSLRRALAVYQTIQSGFSLLAEAYPDYVYLDADSDDENIFVSCG